MSTHKRAGEGPASSARSNAAAAAARSPSRVSRRPSAWKPRTRVFAEKTPASSHWRASAKLPCRSSASPSSAATSPRDAPASSDRRAATSAAMPSPRASASAACARLSPIGSAPAPVPSARAATSSQTAPSLGMQAILLQQVVERGATDTEEPRRVRNVAVATSKRAADDFSIRLLARVLQVVHVGFVLRRLLQVEVTGGHQLAIRHDDRALEPVLQLANVARPMPGVNRCESVWRKAGNLRVHLPREPLEEGLGQQRRIPCPLGQSGNLHHHLGQAIE